MLLLINTLLKIRIWSQIDKLNKFDPSHVRPCHFECEIFEHPCADKILFRNLQTQFRSCPPRNTVPWVKQKKEMIGYICFHDIIPSLFLNFFNNGRAKTFGKEISSLILSVHIVNFDSLFDNILFNPEMSNINVLCLWDGFNWAGYLSCTWIFTENWSILAIEGSFVNFVGKVDNVLLDFYFCDSLKQSIKISFCATSWDVILFPWFPKDQRITKKIQAPDLLFLVSEFRAALSIVELFTDPSSSELRERKESSDSRNFPGVE